VYNAWLNLGSFSSNAFGISVLVGSTLALLVTSAWILRRQAAVAAAL
jgi:membrane-anchored protein YejM (alkaline phosphatase superfamily)